jgi:DNA-binding beta-propeller fold protein YncE
MTAFRVRIVAALILLWVGSGVTADDSPQGYKVLKTIEVGGEGSWDYLTMDAQSRHLYISRSNRVTVVDVDKGKIVGEVMKTTGVHGIALAPRWKQGFTSNGGDNTVTVFDLDTLAEKNRVKVGNRPDAILYDPASDRVFTFNAGSKDTTALAAEDGKVVGTLALGGKPESAVADEKGMIYVNIEDKNEVVAFDAEKLTIKARYPLTGGERPHGMAMDRVKRRLFVSCPNEKMIVLDADSGTILGTPAIGKGTDAAAFDQEAGLAFSSNGSGTLTIIEEKPADMYKVLATVPTQDGARTMALDTKTHNVLLVTARFKPAAPGERRGAMVPDSFVLLVVGKAPPR